MLHFKSRNLGRKKLAQFTECGCLFLVRVCVHIQPPGNECFGEEKAALADRDNRCRAIDHATLVRGSSTGASRINSRDANKAPEICLRNLASGLRFHCSSLAQHFCTVQRLAQITKKYRIRGHRKGWRQRSHSNQSRKFPSPR